MFPLFNTFPHFPASPPTEISTSRRIPHPQKSKLKSSAQRAIRSRVAAEFPLLEPHLDFIIPKKSQLDVLKLPDRISLYSLDGNVLFFQHFDDALMPHLKLVHQYPDCFPVLQTDRGATRFMLQGAQLMCPGLTSAGAKMVDGLDKGTVVAVKGEGKENACLVGVMKMSSDEVGKINKGVAVETCHYLGDHLWRFVGE